MGSIMVVTNLAPRAPPWRLTQSLALLGSLALALLTSGWHPSAALPLSEGRGVLVAGGSWRARLMGLHVCSTPTRRQTGACAGNVRCCILCYIPGVAARDPGSEGLLPAAGATAREPPTSASPSLPPSSLPPVGGGSANPGFVTRKGVQLLLGE
jgi:hypothetical protein